jgi:glycerol-3-phosphate acyltransferase PlsY
VETPAAAAVAAVIGYLIGSFPAAYLIGRAATGVDVRTAGEGNVGARNVFHEVGVRWGLLTFAADFAKGVAVALLFRDRPFWQLAVAAGFMIVGHAYPVWLRFVGGKGLAAAGGLTAALLPLATAIGCAASGPVWLRTRRFLPTLVTAAVGTFLVAPFVGGEWRMIGLALGTFVLVAAKRALDEPRMRTIEAETGWDRARGGTGP